MRRSPWLVVCAAGVLGCDPPAVQLVAPEAVGADAAGLTVHVVLADTVLAARLGWAAGVPGAIVALNRVRAEFRPETSVTDGSGRVVFRDVAPGQYRVWAERVLAHEETGPTGGVVRAFGHGVRGQFAGTETLAFPLQADQRGSVLFSEFHLSGQTDRAPGYVLARYFELYNNSDTTVFLDRMLYGWAWAWHNDNDGLSCEDSESFRNDPAGLWAAVIGRFPGDGSEHPMSPGQAVVIAGDALDHSVFDPAYPNLANADFEILGTVDPDNPAVPNILEVGTRRESDGRGPRIGVSRPVFLATPQDLDALPHRVDPRFGVEWIRIPASAILDVVTSSNLAVELLDNPPYCRAWVPPVFDRLELINRSTADDPSYPRLSFQRRLLGARSQGSPVLLNLDVSMLDWRIGVRSQGTVP